MKPINFLVNEHCVIEQVLNCLERMIERCRTEGRLEEEPARDAITFFREFAERAHLAKEEAIFFPLLSGTEFFQGRRPAELMAREKGHGRTLLDAMAGAVEGAAAGDRDALKRFSELGDTYIGRLLKYIENEEDGLFPHAKRLLNEESKRGLMEEFSKMGGQTTCHLCYEQYLSVADRLADHFGVPRAVLLDV